MISLSVTTSWNRRECLRDSSTVASAVLSAVSKQIRIGEVSTDLLWRRIEVVQRPWLIGKNIARWDENAVCTDALPGVWHPEGVVQRKCSLVVGKAVEIPICLTLSASSFFLFHPSPQAAERLARRRKEVLTWELNIIGVVFVVAIATILKSQVIFPRV